MASISSASTYQQVKDAFDDAASYVEDGSVAKAKALVTAGIMLLNREPLQAGEGSTQTTFNSALIQRQIDAANAFIAANSTSIARSRVLSVRDFRR